MTGSTDATSAAGAGGAPAPAPTPMPRRRPGPFLITAGVLLVATFAWLIWGGLDKNVVFFLEPHELLAKGVQALDVPVRLGGQVKPGTVKWDENTRNLTFDVTDTTNEIIHVKSTGVPPQMFRDGMGVVVEGRLGTDSLFRCTSLMVKHSNEYRAPKPGEQPQMMYKSLIKGAGA